MKHVKIFEAYPYEGFQDTQPDAPRFPSDKFVQELTNTPRRGQIYYDMLPKGLRNELVRPVKEMLLDTDPREWEPLGDIMEKIERFMTKSGLQWKRFPRIGGFSPTKGIAGFVNNLEKGYIQALEDAYFS
jgi:hypothetical protein